MSPAVVEGGYHVHGVPGGTVEFTLIDLGIGNAHIAHADSLSSLIANEPYCTLRFTLILGDIPPSKPTLRYSP